MASAGGSAASRYNFLGETIEEPDPFVTPTRLLRLAAVGAARPRRLALRRLPRPQGAVDGARPLRRVQPVVGRRRRHPQPDLLARQRRPRHVGPRAERLPAQRLRRRARRASRTASACSSSASSSSSPLRGSCAASSPSTSSSSAPCSAPTRSRPASARSSRRAPTTVDASAATLRRIERDLHDGTQAQLVALAMRLGMAKEKLEDPEHVDLDRVRELVDEAHRGAKEAITELRDIARGIHPPALDIGLEGALATLASRSAIPTELQLRRARAADPGHRGHRVLLRRRAAGQRRAARAGLAGHRVVRPAGHLAAPGRARRRARRRAASPPSARRRAAWPG